jgi:hypothetical protein
MEDGRGGNDGMTESHPRRRSRTATASSAERMRRCRDRRRRGAVRISFEVAGAALDDLVALDYLDPDDRRDPDAVGAAVAGLLAETLDVLNDRR